MLTQMLCVLRTVRTVRRTVPTGVLTGRGRRPTVMTRLVAMRLGLCILIQSLQIRSGTKLTVLDII